MPDSERKGSREKEGTIIMLEKGKNKKRKGKILKDGGKKGRRKESFTQGRNIGNESHRGKMSCVMNMDK